MRPMLLVAALLLSGCASIPLSTMARFSNYDESDFAKVDPTEVLVRVAVPSGFSIQSDSTFLSLALNAAGDAEPQSIPLKLVFEDTAELSSGWFSSIAVRRQTLRLSDAGLDLFRTVQRAAAAKEIRSVKFTVAWKFSHVPPDTREVRLWTDLQLSRQDGFFPLFRDVRVPYTDTGAEQGAQDASPRPIGATGE